MDLKWLEDFVALARIGSFSKAASQRYVTQPAFSRRIRSLEDWIGAPLFDRETNPIKLTAAGKEFLPHALSIIAEAESVKQDFRLLYRMGNSAIRIITSHRLSVHMVPKLVSGFLKSHPDLHISVMPRMDSTEKYGDYAHALVTGIADFLITYSHASLILEENLSDRLDHLVIEKDRIIPVASPVYAESIRVNWFENSATRVSYVGYPEYSFTEKIIQPIIQKFEKQLHKIYETPYTGSIRAMLLEGVGMAWLPQSVVSDDIATGSLVRLKGEELSAELSVLIYRRRESTGPVMEQFWRHVAERAGGGTATVLAYPRSLPRST